ncbi:hypothetical protein BGZ97_004904 [Linnemannia gamsii]|jgi:hypothetical protein|uniref:Uncharacterized protein n=1 Tax=Linnemannia gamsii TaxID=64522 RepID=A0A9P6UGL1_9FUNG|nr:hypothetical protein BGZ97_004904 [Linnemannia gamsii]
MILTFKVSNANQARDMLSVRSVLTQINEKLAQQSNQSQWASDMMAGLARTLVRQEKQQLLQQVQIQALQQAIELLGRHHYVPGPILSSNSGFSGSSYTGVPLSYTGVPSPGYLPSPGSSFNRQPFTQKRKKR